MRVTPVSSVGARLAESAGPSRFPDPEAGPGTEPLALGGDLEPGTLIDAYSHGIFPWPAGGRLFWWSPDPREVIPLDGLHVSRSLRRTLRRGGLACTADSDFEAVIRGCTERAEGTWITPAMVAAYTRLHQLGCAHSVEVYAEGELVGGVYGVALGGVFTGESMFHRATDASKVALVCLVERLRRAGFVLFDVQLPTRHLESLGAHALPRSAFLDELAAALTAETDFARVDIPDCGELAELWARPASDPARQR